MQTQPNNFKMSQLTDFLIQFDQPQRVFRPGDLVSGQLLVNLSEQITFSKIEVELVGEGHVYWTETVPQSQVKLVSIFISKKNNFSSNL